MRAERDASLVRVFEADTLVAVHARVAAGHFRYKDLARFAAAGDTPAARPLLTDDPVIRSMTDSTLELFR